MRVLVVNPNTSEGVTRRIAAAARSAGQPGDEVTALSAAFGPELIVTPEDAAEATQGVLATVRTHGIGMDGIVLASFGDTGAAEVRRAWPATPVIGIAEAAFTATRDHAGPFAIVTFAPEVAPSLRDMALRHGVGSNLMQVAALNTPLDGDPADIADALQVPLTRLCQDCAKDGARSVVLGGGPLAGLAARIGPDCPVPLIDGTVEAIHQLRARVTAQPAEADET